MLASHSQLALLTIQVANIIFLDQPVGTGFSYANNWESYNIDDNISIAESYEFLRKVKSKREFLYKGESLHN